VRLQIPGELSAGSGPVPGDVQPQKRVLCWSLEFSLKKIIP
jgi:hypothetical protein